MTKGYLLAQLGEKMQSPDADFRFMALNDLMTEIAQDPTSFTGDETAELRMVQQVMKLVEDKISEVKNQAVKCLGQLIKILRESHLDFVVDKLIDFFGGNDDELRDISGLALKTVTSSLPDGKIAAKACAKLAPKLLLQLKNTGTPPESLIETLAVLSTLITRFPEHLSAATLQPQPLTVLTPLLKHGRPAVRKRAIVTLAQFLPLSPPAVFPNFLQTTIAPSLLPAAPLDTQRTTVQLIGALARYTPQQAGPVLDQFVPGVLRLSTKDDSELREGSLQALETLVLRCPTEVTPFLSPIMGVGTELIKFDPNYAGDDEDEEMGADEDDDDAELEDGYSDDEDTSYKIRRSAAKLLAAIIGTRPELLTTLYKSVSPVLISRFGDREESVRVEVWATYVLLLNQTTLYGGVPQVESAVGGKRKREGDGVEVEDTPAAQLRSQVQTLAKALLKQLQPKTAPATLQAGFTLLTELLVVLPGSLALQAPLLVTTINPVLSQPVTTSTSNLHTTCLSFSRLFFSTHGPPTFSPSLPSVLPTLRVLLAERHPRIASESFRVFSALLNALKPIQSGDWVDDVYAEAVKRLKSNDTDSEVRARAEEAVGDLWVCAGGIVRGKGGAEWEALMRGGRPDGAVKVLARVAKEVDIGDDWVGEAVQWVVGVLRKTGRSGRIEAFGCLDALLRRYSSGVPTSVPPALIPQLAPYLTTSDISLLSQSLSIITLLLQLAPGPSYPLVEGRILPLVYPLAYSPLVSGASLDALLAFFGALVEADAQIATHVIPGMVNSLEKSRTGEGSPANVSKCIGRVVRSAQGVAAGTIAEFGKSIKKTSKAKEGHIVLSLLTLGEIGRFVDMSNQNEIFYNSLDFFTAESEELRSAAAFAAGNIAIGNIHQFLPVIVKQVQSDDVKRLLSLHALKEVVTHCSNHQLEGVADALWVPLFENSQNSQEATRNVAAACLGKLTTTNPARYLPQLQSRLQDPAAEIRATVLSAIRYTFADTAQSYDELLAPLIVEFLSLMLDSDLTVRRLSLSTLNAAARNKPHLIKDHLPTLLPRLYAETVLNESLIRVVQMGPWQHRVDDGLEARKTAYETMYTILDTCLEKINLHEFLTRVLTGLADEADEIKVLCHMMLFRLVQVAPTAVAQRLDDASPELEKTMKGATVTKDTVKQDLERAAELQRSALRAIAGLSKVRSVSSSPRFDALVEDLEKSGTWGPELKELRGAN